MEYRLVSIIIPIYNMAKYLHETLDSVLASDYPNFEVILMDDGSTDNSLDIAKEYAEKDARVSVHTQSNSGPCVARNNAISLSHGEYILPVDADNRISPTFISHAVVELERDPDVKVVCPRAEFIGDRSGEWKLPPFSLKLLARKNMIDTCALYRKTEWERVGGYCEEIIAREDWEFWISVLKDGGKVVRLPQIELYYRVRAGSKRIVDRSLKPHVTKVLNKRHAEFFERELGGKLRSVRSWSRWINRIERFFRPRCMAVAPDYSNMSDFVKVLPVIFEDRGTVIYKGRNELREFDIAGQKVVVKSFQIPHLLNRIIYNFFRESKARRSFRYAAMLRQFNIGSPAPLGFCSVSSWFLFGKSYFVSLRSECPYTYRDLPQRPFEEQEKILRAIARTTAVLHEHGILHKDYSAGNILFAEKPEGVSVEIIDLNRMRFGKVSLEEGCKNFERLPGTDRGRIQRKSGRPRNPVGYRSPHQRTDPERTGRRHGGHRRANPYHYRPTGSARRHGYAHAGRQHSGRQRSVRQLRATALPQPRRSQTRRRVQRNGHLFPGRPDPGAPDFLLAAVDLGLHQRHPVSEYVLRIFRGVDRRQFPALPDPVVLDPESAHAAPKAGDERGKNHRLVDPP